METRPLTDAEGTDIEKQLEAAKEQRKVISGYIVDMEQELREGTAWCYEPKAFRKMCQGIQKEAHKRQKQYEQQEIKHYGRLLTDAERRGWEKTPRRTDNE